MTAREYLDKLYFYFFEHFNGIIDDVLVIKEKNGKFIMQLMVDNPHEFMDWWEAIYVPLDSWIHEYDADYEVSGDKVIFSIREK